MLCALFPRLCAHAGTIGEALALLKPRRAGRGRRPAAPGRPRARGHGTASGAAAGVGTGAGAGVGTGAAAGGWVPQALPQLDFGELPRDPGVYVFRDGAGRALYVGKSLTLCLS